MTSIINDQVFMHEYSIEWLLLSYDNENQTISVRRKFSGNQGSFPLDEFITSINEEIKTRSN